MKDSMITRQRLTNDRKSFSDLVRENLNKEQIDSLIKVPEWNINGSEIRNYFG